MKGIEREKSVWWSSLVLGAALFLLSSPTFPQQNLSTCYRCHIQSTPRVADAWKDSPHYGKLTCDFCHNGNPQKKITQEAHQSLKVPDTTGRIELCGSCHSEQKQMYATSSHKRILLNSLNQNPSLFSTGISLDKITKGKQPLTGPECTTCHGVHNVLATSNPEAPTYLRKVSELCGLVCHQPTYSQFVKSNHYQALREEHEAPTCITCHTAHADRIVPTSELTKVCAKCHSQSTGIAPQAPEQMQDTLRLTSLAQNLFSTTNQRVNKLKREGWDTSRVEVYLNQVEQRFQTIPVHWHRFNQKTLQNDVEWIIDTINLVQKKLKELKLTWWMIVGIAAAWAFISFLAWVAYIRSKKTSIFLLASGFSILFVSMFLRAELLKNILQVAGAVIIALGVILPEISVFFQTKKNPSGKS